MEQLSVTRPESDSDTDLLYLFPWQSVVEITTTVTNRYDELDEVVCELLPDKQTVV